MASTSLSRLMSAVLEVEAWRLVDACCIDAWISCSWSLRSDSCCWSVASLSSETLSISLYCVVKDLVKSFVSLICWMTCVN